MLVIIIILILFIVLFTAVANTGEWKFHFYLGPSAALSADIKGQVCLTKEEARQLWPKAYLKWRGNHCWYGGKEKLKIEIIRQPKLEEEDQCCWPQLTYDANDNLVAHTQTFDERWQATYDVWRHP